MFKFQDYYVPNCV